MCRVSSCQWTEQTCSPFFKISDCDPQTVSRFKSKGGHVFAVRTPWLWADQRRSQNKITSQNPFLYNRLYAKSFHLFISIISYCLCAVFAVFMYFFPCWYFASFHLNLFQSALIRSCFIRQSTFWKHFLKLFHKRAEMKFNRVEKKNQWTTDSKE